MKKLISVLASVMVMASVTASVTVPASADTGAAFQVAQVSTVGEVANGALVQDETVMVPVTIEENQGITAFLLEFAYDNSNIQLNKISYDETDYNTGQFTWNIEKLRLLWSDNACQDRNHCGTVAVLEFTVPAGTPVGQYEIGFNEQEIQVTNTNFDSIEYTVTSGYIEVGGEPSENPQVTEATEAPVVTQAPVVTTKTPVVTTVQKPVTEVPATTKIPTKAPQATAAETTAAEENAAGAVTTTAESDSQDSTASGTAVMVEGTLDGAVLNTGESTLSTDESAAVSGGSDSASTDKGTSSKKDKGDASSTLNNKTSNSPSTGAASLLVPGALLVVSAAGVIVAVKSKNKK